MTAKTNNKSVRRYFVIWDAISKAPVGKKVSVRAHQSAAATLIQAVSKEKSRETAEKKKLGMPFAGKLVIEREAPDVAGYVTIHFSLEWDGRRL